MNPTKDKWLRRMTIVTTVTASYFLLTADYGPEPNVLDPIKKTIQSAEQSVKNFVLGRQQKSQENNANGKK